MTFEELFHSAGLARLDNQFLNHLKTKHPETYQFLLAYRQKSSDLLSQNISEQLIRSAHLLEDFLIELFSIEDAHESLRLSIIGLDPIFAFKKEFVLKFAKRRLKKNEALPSFNLLDQWLKSEKEIAVSTDMEHAIANYAMTALQNNQTDIVEKITDWCIHILKQSIAPYSQWVSFKLPRKLDYQSLVKKDHLTILHRDGFSLTDPRMSEKEIQSEIHYCVYCHRNNDDFCSKGFPNKKNHSELGFKKNPLNVTLTGCPLEEKISEMQLLKKNGRSIAALAMVMLDNPMCPATGHRICNDCMKSCIYQKQDPVNIPEIETRVLTDVLNLPWGVELYDLLTRWNPLRQEQFVQKPHNNKSVMVVGLGPAGFTLAHHLLMEGCHVVGVDGLKIEPLDKTYLKKPIYDYQSLTEDLDDRITAGFGGVAEYGITSRWDKNFLKLIYITLMRRSHFEAYGGVRFGGTITINDAKQMGFNHLAIAVGAGLPKALPIHNSLAPGMRQANDFLMALQLTGAAKKESLTNLQIRLPLLVIGGGLTGVDAATEAQAYYIRQVEKTLDRYKKLCHIQSEKALRSQFNESDLMILDEHLAHANAIKLEREKAILENRAPDFVTLIQKWGGVTIAYRRHMEESPAYISNHEELQYALNQGILYCENLWPKTVQLDQYGQVSGLVCKRRHHNKNGEWALGEEMTIKAKTILVATGAQLNIAYSFEHKDELAKENGHYIPHEFKDGKLTAIAIAPHCKSDYFGPFTSYQADGFNVSFIGDSHPVFHGNVVKAIASAKRSYPKIISAIKKTTDTMRIKTNFAEYFTAIVHDVKKITQCSIELTITCPAVCLNAKPGQFFRLQTYEKNAKLVHQTALQSEALSLAASQIDLKNKTLTFVVINKGVSSQLCQRLKRGDKVSLMGPGGVRSRLQWEQDCCLIVGNQLAAAQASVLAQHYQQATITFLTNDTQSAEIAKQFCKNIKIIDHASLFEIFSQYAELMRYRKILLIGDKSFLIQSKQFLTQSRSHFHPNVRVYAGIYAPMQCMLKGVCAQCLTWQLDANTGHRTKAVYACSWQHQPLEIIDLDNYFDRLSQNHMQETLTEAWYKAILAGVSR